MDKYQNFLTRNLYITTELAKKIDNKENVAPLDMFDYDTTFGAKEFSFRNDEISIRQNDNYELTKYDLIIKCPTIDKVWIEINEQKIYGDSMPSGEYKLILDFNNKAKNLYISFKESLADVLIIPINYLDADKDKRNEYIAMLHQKELDKIVDIEINTGNSLANIIFNPINEKYNRTKVKLFYETNTQTKESSYRFMGEFTSENDMFFISIVNLAYADYAIELYQYDNEDNVIYKSEKVAFEISGRNIHFI